jgi:hypothetical protein
MNWTITAYLGAGLITVAAALALRQHFWLRSAQLADGTVIELIASRGSKGRTVYTPRVHYCAADGSEREFTRRWRSRPAGFFVGEHVAVAYDPATGEARILTFGQRFGLAAIIASVGVALVCMAACFIAGRTLVPRLYQQRTATPPTAF